MAIPDFTQYGILPPGIHECSLPEAKNLLCSNERRLEIWSGLQLFLEWVAEFPAPDALLLDGSYVTDKALPNDVDVVVDITGCSEDGQRRWIKAWATHHEYAKATFSVDFYPVAIGVGNDFSAFFQYVRIEEAMRRGIDPTMRKGILKVTQ